MKRHDKPKLRVWPHERSVHEFANAADQLPQEPAVRKRTTPGEFQEQGKTVAFVVRMSAAHHESLAWLSEVSRSGPRRLSMQTVLLDLLEPALEAEVERRRKELGL